VKKKLLEEQKEMISLEDLIESQRAALGSNVTKVTLETFIAWKKRKIEEKKQELVKEEEKKNEQILLNMVVYLVYQVEKCLHLILI